MQYDVQPSGPTTAEQAASPRTKPAFGLGARLGRGASRSAAPAPASAPPLRDRLREVLERDRALIEAHRPVEAARQAHALLHEAHDTAASEAEAKSGAHARSPVEVAPDSSLFALWIEEEITEEQIISEAPVVFESHAALSSDELDLLVAPADDELDLLLEELVGVESEVTRRGPPPVEVESEVTRRGPPPSGPAPRPRPMPATSTPEPIVTLTMARLLATHGYHVRALSIYDALIARAPYNQELWAEAERLRG